MTNNTVRTTLNTVRYGQNVIHSKSNLLLSSRFSKSVKIKIGVKEKNNEIKTTLTKN
jgi:hypothetical protein